MTTSRKLHVTHIASGDLWAGAEVQLYTLCKALNKHNEVTVSVILLNHGTLEEKLKEISIPVVVLNEAKLNGLQIWWRIFKQLTQEAPDIVHTHRTKENILGGLAAQLAHIPSLRTVHGAPEHRPGWLSPHKRLLYMLDWLTGHYLQAIIIAVSKELKILLETKFHQDKLRIIENGIDIGSLEQYRKPAIAKQANRQRSYKVGLVGRLVPVKRVDLFIQTAKYLCDHQPDLQIQFHIYGDGPLRAELEELVKTLNMENTVQFEGHSPHIHPQIASLDALLITSDHEGLPMTLLEAMTLGIPVVAHAVGGISTVCQDGQCCWLIDHNSVDKLALGVLECLQNTPDRINKINLAHRQISNRYSAETNANLYLDMYRNVII